MCFLLYASSSPRPFSCLRPQVRGKRLPESDYGIVVKSKERSFTLCLSEEREQQKWIQAIQDAVEKYRARLRRSTVASPGKNANVEGFGETAPVWVSVKRET